ncbi:hypothetical protein [Deinococcus sp.]|uniref:hypothetical protein n=1 Tax=Deinococcus sp. TaxID=47478 RepID=UPI0025EEA45B|nr:hypothetical protein [Deinococcus sp.]
MPDLEREFLYRLLTNNSGGSRVEEKLYVGELPPDFPIKLPENIRLIGANEQKAPPVPRGAQGMYIRDHTRVLLDSPLSVPEFISQLRVELAGEWERFEWPHMQRGFLPAEAQDGLNLYSTRLKLSLNVQAAEVGEVTQVTLDLNAQDDDARERMRMHSDHYQGMLVLNVRVPAGATLQPGGGGHGGNHWSSSATIECTLSAAELLDHFGQQLTAQGWLPLTRGESLEAAAACWTNSAGNLAFISLSKAGPTYQASIMTVGEPSGDSGHASSSASFSF